MQFNDLKFPLIVIVGPTAVGKTEFSIQLAKEFNGEIVSADSRLIYREMNIGTAKPSLIERRGIPHHLIDVTDPDHVWSLPTFQNAATVAINDIHVRGCLPILVGGTGQYIRSIIQGWEPPPQPHDLKLRNTIETWGTIVGARELHKRLSVIDPQAAANIEPNNLRRTTRAMEVIFYTGKRFSDQQRKKGTIYDQLIIGLKRPRSDLFLRIDKRIELMFANGFVEEVKRLLEKGYPTTLPAFSAIGYKQVITFIQGDMSFVEATTEIKRLTRQFVRRQANWFKENDPSIHWIDCDNEPLKGIEKLLNSSKGWISPE